MSITNFAQCCSFKGIQTCGGSHLLFFLFFYFFSKLEGIIYNKSHLKIHGIFVILSYIDPHICLNLFTYRVAATAFF